MDKSSNLPPEQGSVGPHLDEDRALDLLLDQLSEPEVDAVGRHVARCARCENLLRRRGASLERRRAAFESPNPLRSDPAAEQSTGADWWAEPESAQRERLEAWPAWPVAAYQWLAGVISRSRYAFGLGGVAILVAVVLLVIRSTRDDAPFPATAQWLPSATETLNLRNNPDGSSALDAALRAYDRRDLPAAIQALSTSQPSEARENLRLLYLGSSLTQEGAYREAVRVLRSCPLSDLPNPWRSEGYWTLLVALHGAGETAAADSLLHRLAGQEDTVGIRARGLLHRVKP
jgi:hypothetical protein